MTKFYHQPGLRRTGPLGDVSNLYEFVGVVTQKTRSEL